MARPEWIRIIHVAQRDLDLDEKSYRKVLESAGVASSKDIKSEAQFDQVMAEMRAMGFKKKPATRRPKWKDNFWRCSDDQRAKIEVLWANVARTPTPEALRKFIARIIHIDHPSWISTVQAAKVILALQAMAVQAGLDPDKAERAKLKEEQPCS